VRTETNSSSRIQRKNATVRSATCTILRPPEFAPLHEFHEFTR
jgi:hypothetical protein